MGGWVNVGTSTRVWRGFVVFYEKVRKTTEKKVFVQRGSKNLLLQSIG
jgi:hypothetical protein